MRVLIASADYTPDGGGIGAYANGLWTGLRAAGCEASVLSRSTALRRETKTERMLPVEIGGFAKGALNSLRIWYQALRAEVVQRNSEWIVIPTWDPVGLAATLPFLRGRIPCRIAVIFHGADLASARNRKARLLRYVIQASDKLICNSSYTRELLQRRFGAASSMVQPGIGGGDLGEAGDVGRSAEHLISVGRLVKRKGHAMVLEAVARLAPSFPGIIYTIVGDGPERTRLETLAGSLGISGRVHMTGHIGVAEKRRLLRTASIFALPVVPDDCDPEGFGIAYLEAGAARLPVVATRSGGVADCVREGDSGLFCEPTINGVTGALRELLQRGILRAQLGDGGRRIAEASTWNHRAIQLLAALQERG